VLRATGMLHFCARHASDPVDLSRRDGRAGLFRSGRVAPNHSSLRGDTAKSTVADSCEYEKPFRQENILFIKKTEFRIFSILQS